MELSGQAWTKEAAQPVLAILPELKWHPLAVDRQAQPVAAAVVEFLNGHQLGWGFLVPELERFEGALEVGLLAVAPAGDISQKLAQRFALRPLAQVAQLEATQLSNAAAVEIARVTLSHTTITAPIAGRLGLRQLDAGNMVRAGDAAGLVTITQLQPVAVSFTLPQQALPGVNARLREGEPLAVEATVPGATEPERGTVALVDNQIDSTTGTIRLKAVFPNPTLTLWPGGFVNIRLRLDTIRDAVLVPGNAIQFGPDGVFAYVVGADLRAQPRPLTIGRTDGERTVVLSGVQPGERVVVTGQDRLRAGSRVTIAGEEGAAPRGGAGPRRPPGTGS